ERNVPLLTLNPIRVRVQLPACPASSTVPVCRAHRKPAYDRYLPHQPMPGRTLGPMQQPSRSTREHDEAVDLAERTNCVLLGTVERPEDVPCLLVPMSVRLPVLIATGLQYRGRLQPE